MSTVFIVIICLILFILLIWFISASNQIKRLSIKINEAASLIDVALQNRYDVINSLVEVVKGHMKYEKEVLFDIVKIRNNLPIDEKIKENDKLTDNYERVKLLVENYPELKTDKSFLKLQETIVEVENVLQASRRMYNSNVSIYNQMISTFPNNMIANIFGYNKKEFFTAKEVSSVVNINVQN